MQPIVFTLGDWKIETPGFDFIFFYFKSSFDANSDVILARYKQSANPLNNNDTLHVPFLGRQRVYTRLARNGQAFCFSNLLPGHPAF